MKAPRGGIVASAEIVGAVAVVGEWHGGAGGDQRICSAGGSGHAAECGQDEEHGGDAGTDGIARQAEDEPVAVFTKQKRFAGLDADAPEFRRDAQLLQRRAHEIVIAGRRRRRR